MDLCQFTNQLLTSFASLNRPSKIYLSRNRNFNYIYSGILEVSASKNCCNYKCQFHQHFFVYKSVFRQLLCAYLQFGQGILAHRELQATNEYLLEQVVFINAKYFFHNTNGQLKTGKTGTHLSADTSPVQCSRVWVYIFFGKIFIYRKLLVRCW